VWRGGYHPSKLFLLRKPSLSSGSRLDTAFCGMAEDFFIDHLSMRYGELQQHQQARSRYRRNQVRMIRRSNPLTGSRKAATTTKLIYAGGHSAQNSAPRTKFGRNKGTRKGSIIASGLRLNSSIMVTQMKLAGAALNYQAMRIGQKNSGEHTDSSGRFGNIMTLYAQRRGWKREKRSTGRSRILRKVWKSAKAPAPKEVTGLAFKVKKSQGAAGSLGFSKEASRKIDVESLYQRNQSD